LRGSHAAVHGITRVGQQRKDGVLQDAYKDRSNLVKPGQT
jgi:hypothetical protein